MWWPSTHEFDNGEAPVGHIFLAGHTRIGWIVTSPLEMRQLDEREKPLVVGIFGHGLHKQHKLTNSLIMSR